MDKMKKGFLALAAIGGLALFSASASSAMPVSNAPGIATSSADLQQAGWRWRHRGWHSHGWRRGWGWHRRGWHRYRW
jgi:hypothetical protein